MSSGTSAARASGKDRRIQSGWGWVAAAVCAALLGCADGGGGSVSDTDTVDGAGLDALSPVGSPSELVLQALDGALTLDWSWPAGHGTPEAWRVHYRVGLPGPPWDGQGAHGGDSPIEWPIEWAAKPELHTATLTGLRNGEPYFVAVSAQVGGVWGAPSDWASAVPRRDADSMVLVPAGVFLQGADPYVYDADESPARAVYLDAFWQDRYVATNAEFRACVDADACPPPAEERGFLEGVSPVDDYFTNPLYDDFPVVFLEYEAAAAYCAWQGKRLPTEAEWEKSARGGWGHERAFPWGDAEPTCEVANFNDDGLFCVGGPVPVGSLADVNESPFGAAELGGNVWEWTSDWYAEDAYTTGGCVNPSGPAEGDERVLRGGAWYYPVRALSVVYRNQWAPTFTSVGDAFQDYRGFGVRCVKDAVGVACDPAVAVCELPEDAPCPGGEGPDVDAGGADAGDTDAEEPDGDEPDAADLDADDGLQPDGALPDAMDGADSADSDAGAPDADGDDGLGDAADSDDGGGADADATVPCGWPQDVDTDPGLCSVQAPPTCPSGWPDACAQPACACAVSITADVDPCAEPASLSLKLGWRDGSTAFHPFSAGQPFELCQGFQGGFHVALFIEVSAEGFADEPTTWQAHTVATADIDGVRVGGFEASKVPYKKQPNGAWRSALIPVVFESCNAGYFAGLSADVRVLVRRPDGRWGKATIHLELLDDVNGPFLDPAQEDPC